eukprot:s2689_g5.t1
MFQFARMSSHKIFLFGGYDGKGRTNELYILDTAEAKWVRPTWPTESPHTPPGRQRHSAPLIGSKRIYIFGGFDGNKWLNDLHVLDVGRLEEQNQFVLGRCLLAVRLDFLRTPSFHFLCEVTRRLRLVMLIVTVRGLLMAMAATMAEESALNDVAVHTLIENMGRLLKSHEFSDIVFLVEGKPIYAHKAILVAQCEHFRAMFAGGRFAESREAEIEIPQWSHTAFNAMLEWLYTGHAPRELSAEHLTEVLGLADHYTLDGLKHVCENVLIHSVEIDNVCSLLRISARGPPMFIKACFLLGQRFGDLLGHSDQYMAHELKRYCLAFILKNFDQVAYTQAFDELSSMPSLLLEVTRAAATKDQVLRSVERFDPHLGHWEDLAPMPQRRHGVAAAALEGQLWVCGGSYGRQDVRTVEVYDVDTFAWVQMPSMHMPRNCASMAFVRF